MSAVVLAVVLSGVIFAFRAWKGAIDDCQARTQAALEAEPVETRELELV